MKSGYFYRNAAFRFVLGTLAIFFAAAFFNGASFVRASDDSSRVTPEEKAFASEWISGILSKTPVSEESRIGGDLPFSFHCGERSSREWVTRENMSVTLGEWKDGKRQSRLTWKDSETSLVCEIEWTEYADFPAAEWLIRLRNESDQDSEKIHDFRALDAVWKTPDVLPYLYRAHGSEARMEDFHLEREELRESLWTKARDLRMNFDANKARRSSLGDSLINDDGRPSAMWLPFFNLQTKDDGLIVGLGWDGGWFADFCHDGAGNVQINAGMERLNAKLHPGEAIRSPLILTMYYRGSFLHAQNVFRQFVLRYHTPQENGQPVRLPNCLSAWGATEEKAHLAQIEKMVEKHKMPYDCFWIDAGWYGQTFESNAGGTDAVSDSNWASSVGDWRPNLKYYPNGLGSIGEKAAANGMRFLLWFETERACWGVPGTMEHPEWYLKPDDREPFTQWSVLFNLGNPEARAWMTDWISNLLSEYKISIYREDFNMVPDKNWALYDEPDRQGMTEMRFVEGLYQFWDDLLARHPGLLIDNCASGGRRLELETMKRSVALWRTDYNCFSDIQAESIQAHGFGLSYWIPANAIAPTPGSCDTYQARSAMSAGSILSADPETKHDWLLARLNEAKRAQPFFYGDFYPLEGDGNDDLATWLVECFQIPENNSGMILAFRRPQASARSMTFDIPQLDLEKVYHFEDVDSQEEWEMTGKELQEKGLTVTIPNPKESRLIFWATAKE